jgi:hypothetical protein
VHQDNHDKQDPSALVLHEDLVGLLEVSNDTSLTVREDRDELPAFVTMLVEMTLVLFSIRKRDHDDFVLELHQRMTSPLVM